MTNKTALCRSTLKKGVVLASFGFFISCMEGNGDLEVSQEKYDSLLQVVKEYKRSEDSVQRQTGKREAVNTPVFYGKEFEEIQDPEEHIINALRNQPDIINLEPVLGGTMKFREIKILSRDWIMARYDDGHIQGESIYRYDLQPDGGVQFEVITSQHPE